MKGNRLRPSLLVLLLMSIANAAPTRAAKPAMHESPTSFAVTVTPAATGRQLVRVSLPVPQGLLAPGYTFTAVSDSGEVATATRVLTWYPTEPNRVRSARRALVTFPFEFQGVHPVRFWLKPAPEVATTPDLPVDIRVGGDALILSYENGPALTARVVAPARQADEAARVETVESNRYFLWQRFHFDDPQWPREIEVRVDALGGVAVVAHLRRDLPGDDYAPEFGWELNGELSGAHIDAIDGQSKALIFGNAKYRLLHPSASFIRRGRSELQRNDEGNVTYRYLRCTPEQKVPMQQASWRRAEFVVGPTSLALPTPTLESPHTAQVEWQLWDALYGTGEPVDLTRQPELADLARYHHEATLRTMLHGDDWGNLTFYADDRDTGDVFGMNRLNHCMAIFREGYRSGDARLVETAVLWCRNFYDQTIWWGPDQTGGTRYNNQRAMGLTPPDNDNNYMWRSNSAVSFCTKGFASFFFAYEQTGDPRMQEALDAQVNYASQYLTAGLDYTRNVGVVHDFLLLYRFTREQRYLDQALRLFRDLRAVLSTGDLFTEGGRPIVPDPPYIDDDNVGPQYPYAKPYIIGYALEGLPELAEYAPDEPKLQDVVRAVSNFLTETQDPAGGWRYPHPRSSYLSFSQAIEQAWQLTQAEQFLGPHEAHLDAIERILRQRILGWRKTGRILTGVTGWEISSGAIKEQPEIYNLYKKPADRDPAPDYVKGNVNYGTIAPEAIVYFPEVLAFYLKHRDAGRLLAPAGEDEPLGQILARVEQPK